MRAVVQRVAKASVTVGGQVAGAIDEPGLLVLVGITHRDTPELAARMAAKVWGLRILDGEKSCSDVDAPLLVISQFTLYAELARGRRPSWSAAAPGPVAEPLVGAVVQALREARRPGADRGIRRRDEGLPGQRRPSHRHHRPVTASPTCYGADLSRRRPVTGDLSAGALAFALGPSPASTHCGRARSDTWSCDRNDVWQNVRAAEPQ